MTTRTREFTLEGFDAFALVGEHVPDGERLLADKLAREAAAADLSKRQQGFEFFSPTTNHKTK